MKNIFSISYPSLEEYFKNINEKNIVLLKYMITYIKSVCIMLII